VNIYMICTLWTPFQPERDWKNSYREILLIPLYIFYSLWMDPMSGFDIRLVFTLPPSDSTLQYKTCVHFWNNFPCIKFLIQARCNLKQVCLYFLQKTTVHFPCIQCTRLSVCTVHVTFNQYESMTPYLVCL